MAPRKGPIVSWCAQEDSGQSAGSMLGAAVAHPISRRGPQPPGQSDEAGIEAALSQRGPRMSEAGITLFVRYWPQVRIDQPP